MHACHVCSNCSSGMSSLSFCCLLFRLWCIHLRIHLSIALPIHTCDCDEEAKHANRSVNQVPPPSREIDCSNFGNRTPYYRQSRFVTTRHTCGSGYAHTSNSNKDLRISLWCCL